MILLAPSLAYSTLFKNWDQRKKTEKSHYQNQINQHHNDKDTKTLQKYNDVQLSCLTCFDHDRLIHSITICSSENIHGDNNNIFFKISLVYRRKVRSSTRMVIWRALGWPQRREQEQICSLLVSHALSIYSVKQCIYSAKQCICSFISSFHCGPECSAHLRLKSCLVLPS